MRDQIQQLQERLQRLEAQARALGATTRRGQFELVPAAERAPLVCETVTRPHEERTSEQRANQSVVPSDPDTLLGRRETAAALTAAGYKVAYSSLERWACTGEGPPYQKFGGTVVYHWRTVLNWARERSTAPRASAVAHRNQHRPERNEC
jgi:hypothetical protein